MKKKRIAIIGGGPAAIFCASFLDTSRYEVRIYEQKKRIGQKFLVAGKGGFNLSHGSAIEAMRKRYQPSSFLDQALEDFSNIDLRTFLTSIGIETYVGSSNRVFPIEGIKPIEVLKALTKHLEEKAVEIHCNYHWAGFDDEQSQQADYTILALGGKSWQKTGSDGRWTSVLEQQGIDCIPFQASNCAHRVAWSTAMQKFEGRALKNIALSCEDMQQKGELVLTAFGLEGGALYALSPAIRRQLQTVGKARVLLNLKPQLSVERIVEKLSKGRKKKESWSSYVKRALKFSSLELTLVKKNTDKVSFTNPLQLAQRIQSIPLDLLAAAPIDEAISTVGGLALSSLDEQYQLKKLPGVYAIGEMIDWDAPTGGYLLQACFSMGVRLARHLNAM